MDNYYPDMNVNNDEFGSNFQKIIHKQHYLENKRRLLKNEQNTLKFNLSILNKEKEERIKQKEILKLSVIEEQDNCDSINDKLNDEIISIKALLSDVELLNEQSKDYIEKNLILESFLIGISETYKNLQEKANNFVLRSTQENIVLRDEVECIKGLNEKLKNDAENQFFLCKIDLEQLDNALTLMKKILFEKHLKLSKVSVTAEYINVEEAKYTMDLKHSETQLDILLSDGKKDIDGKQTLICELDESDDILRSKRWELETVEKEAEQSVFNLKNRLNELEELYKGTESEEKLSDELLQMKDRTVKQLIEEISSQECDLKIKENISHDNERMVFLLKDMGKEYNGSISERTQIEVRVANVNNDINKLLNDLETENYKKIGIIEKNGKLESNFRELKSLLNNMIQKHHEDLNSLNDESARSGTCLDTLKDTLLRIQMSSSEKSCLVKDAKLQVLNNETSSANFDNISEVEIKKVNVLKTKIEENDKKYVDSLNDLNTQLDSKVRALDDMENMAERIRFLEEEINQTAIQLEHQHENNHSELLHFKQNHELCMKDAEERKKLLKIEWENKLKKLQTDVFATQTAFTDLQNIELTSKTSGDMLRKELSIVKPKVIQLHKTKELVRSKFTNAIKNLGSFTEYKMDDITSSQISLPSVDKKSEDSIQKKQKRVAIADDDSSSGISTSDEKWTLPKKRIISSTSSKASKEQLDYKKKMLPRIKQAGKK